MAKRGQTWLMSALTPKADTPQFIRSRVEQITNALDGAQG